MLPLSLLQRVEALDRALLLQQAAGCHLALAAHRLAHAAEEGVRRIDLCDRSNVARRPSPRQTAAALCRTPEREWTTARGITVAVSDLKRVLQVGRGAGAYEVGAEQRCPGCSTVRTCQCRGMQWPRHAARRTRQSVLRAAASLRLQDRTMIMHPDRFLSERIILSIFKTEREANSKAERIRTGIHLQ